MLAGCSPTRRNTNINITDYESLLLAAKGQAEPQRMLFVFLKTSLSDDRKGDEAARFHSDQGGEIEPVMCVDKTLDELGSFADLVKESERIEKNWQIVLVAGLSGRNGQVPSSDEASEPLEMMVRAVESGGDLSKFLAFDRKGVPLQLSK